MEACADRKNPPFCAIDPLGPYLIECAKRFNPLYWKCMVDVLGMPERNKAHYTRMYHLSTMYWVQVNGQWVRKH